MRIPARLPLLDTLWVVRHCKLIQQLDAFTDNISALAYAEAPKLFGPEGSLILIDPIIRIPEHPLEFKAGAQLKTGLKTQIPAQLALKRRDRWATKEEAFKTMTKSALFSQFDKRALQAYVEYGTMEDEDGNVTLVTDKLQEAAVFADDLAFFEGSSAIAELSTKIKVLVVLASKPGPITAVRDEKEKEAIFKGTQVEEINSGHLIVQEVPNKLSKVINNFINNKLSCKL